MLGVAFPNALVKSVQSTSFVTGDNTAYTVPAGRKALLCLTTGYITSGTVQLNPIAVLGGVKFQIGQDQFSSPSSRSASAIVLEAGDAAGWNLPAASTGGCLMQLIEMDATAPLKRVTLTTVASGDNVLYTAPTSGRGSILTYSDGFPTAFGNGGVVSFFRASGTSVLVTSHIGDVGVTASSNTNLTGGSSVGTSKVDFFGPRFIGPGQSLILKAASAFACNVWASFIEL